MLRVKNDSSCPEDDLTQSPRIRPALAGLVTGALLLAACSTTGSPSGSVSTLTGTLTISGSSTVEPITSIVAEDFKAANPGVSYTVDNPGTGDGFVLFCNGETDISDASRQIKDEEATACADNGINYIGLKIGIDGLSVMTSPQNDAVSCLSFLDLYALLGPESQGFDNWSAANDLAAELGSLTDFGTTHAPYPDLALEITAPGEESGTYDSFVELALAKIAAEREQDAVARPDYISSRDDNVIVTAIAGSEGSLGWVGFAFADQNSDTVKSLEVDGGDGCVDPTPDTIASGDYPLSRSLYIYVNTDKAEDSAALAAFVDFYLSDAGIAAVTEADYVALDSDELAATRTAWESH